MRLCGLNSRPTSMTASLLKLPPSSVCSISLIASRMHFRYFHLSRVLRGPIAISTGLVFAPATLGHVLQGFLETAQGKPVARLSGNHDIDLPHVCNTLCSTQLHSHFEFFYHCFQ